MVSPEQASAVNADGNTCDETVGTKTALSGDGAAMTVTKDAEGRAACLMKCQAESNAQHQQGCCRYAEGIPPWEATVDIPVDRGARCWSLIQS